MTLTAMRDLLKDERIWCVAATVRIHEGDDTYFERTRNGQISVSVVTNQHAVPISALLAGGDANSRGYWIIPSIGTEVIVAFDNGEFEGDAYIVGTIGKSPTEITEEVTIIADTTVKIVADKVNICGANEVTEGVVVGSGIDSFTGSPYHALGNTSTRVFAKK